MNLEDLDFEKYYNIMVDDLDDEDLGSASIKLVQHLSKNGDALHICMVVKILDIMVKMKKQHNES